MAIAESLETAKQAAQHAEKLLPTKKKQRSGWQSLVPRAITREGIVLERHVREGRFQRSLAFITAFSGLFTGLEVGYQHYRGSYGQRIMYTPFILSFALGVAGAWAMFSRWAARTVLRLVSLIARTICRDCPRRVPAGSAGCPDPGVGKDSCWSKMYAKGNFNACSRL